MPAFKTCLLTLPLGLLVLPAALHAEAAPDPAAVSPDDANAPRDIVVTALRTPVPRDQVSSSVTVLDMAAIQQAQPVALTDVLQRTPGITVNRNGGYGQTTGLSIRGAGTGQTVVVIDGMRVSDPTAPDGKFDLAQLFTDDIARIEILRGPQAILWGSDAIGGVINVVTAAPTRPLEEDFSVEAGSHRTVNAHAGLGGTSSLIDWRISGSAFTTDGIPTLAGGTQANGDTRKAASATTTFHLAANVSLDLRGYWDEGRNSFSDGFSYPIYGGEYQTTHQWTAYAGLNVALFDGAMKNRLAILENHTDSENYDPRKDPALTFVGHGRIHRYEYQGSLDLARQIQLVFGAERKEERVMTGSPFDAVMPFDLTPHHADTDSGYAQARVEPVKGLTLNGGVRYDHHSTYGGHTVFSAGGVYTPDGGTTLIRANYDQGFKAPSLYQLYSDYGNTTLRPETARGWEVGAERRFGQVLSASATWFERKTTNLIEFADCPFPLPAIGTGPAAINACYINGFGYYQNVDRVKAKGLELAASLRLGRLFADGNYSFISSQDRTPDAATYGQQLPRVPRHLANATLGYDWQGGLTTSVAVRTASSSTDTDFDSFPSVPVTLGAYAVIDLRAEWKLLPGVTVFGRVENVGDKNYQTAYGYNSLGRTGYVGIRTHL